MPWQLLCCLLAAAGLSLSLATVAPAEPDPARYVGSAACAACHAGQYERFQRSSKKAHSSNSVKIMAAKHSTAIMVTHDVDEAVLLSDRIVMMTNGPAARIGEILQVTLERPRDRVALANDPVYQGCRTAVLDFLYRKQGNPALAAA